MHFIIYQKRILSFIKANLVFKVGGQKVKLCPDGLALCVPWGVVHGKSEIGLGNFLKRWIEFSIVEVNNLGLLGVEEGHSRQGM
jgi:hypothetical protein